MATLEEPERLALGDGHSLWGRAPEEEVLCVADVEVSRELLDRGVAELRLRKAQRVFRERSGSEALICGIT